jgi:hypothetical protein
MGATSNALSCEMGPTSNALSCEKGATTNALSCEMERLQLMPCPMKWKGYKKCIVL